MTRALFIGIGYNGLRIVSEDGRRWQQAQTGKEGEIYRASAFGRGRCVIAGSYGGEMIFAATTDGERWETVKQNAPRGGISGLLCAQERFLALGGDAVSVGAARPYAIFSDDGLKWSDPTDIPGGFLLRRLACGNGLLVGVGDRGKRSISSDGHAWKDMPDVRALDTLVSIAYGNGAFVGVGLNGLRMRTEDGLTWTDRQTGEEGEHLNSILWTGQQFVAVGAGATYVSPDGRRWDRKPNTNSPLTAVYGNGLFVGARWRGRILVSEDAMIWQEIHRCDYHIEAMGYGSLA